MKKQAWWRRGAIALLAGMLLAQGLCANTVLAINSQDDFDEDIIETSEDIDETDYNLDEFGTSVWQATPTNDGTYIHDFDADYYLSRDNDGTSRLRVVEKITATFPASDRTHGLVRVIPFTNQNGENLTMASDEKLDIKVLHNGKPEQVAKVESGDGFFRVYLGDADVFLHGEQNYTLEYEFVNVITEQTGNISDGVTSWQELYWDTNGNDWGNSFDEVTARVHLSSDLSKKYLGQNACYTGGFGSKDQNCITYSNSDESVITFSTEYLDSYENLTFALAFKAETFTIPEKPKDYSMLVVAGIVIAGCIIIVFLAYRQYSHIKAKVKHYKNYFVKPEYTPISGITVAEMQQNSIKSFSGNPAVATLMELAVTGKIAIHKETKDDGILHDKNSWSIEILSDDLLPEQRNVLEILHSNTHKVAKGDIFELKRSSYDIASTLIALEFKKNIEQKLKDLGLKEERVKKQENRTAAVTISSFVWVMISVFLVILFGQSVSYREMIWNIPAKVIAITGAGLTAITVMFFVTIVETYGTRTEKGLETARYLEGLKLYVKMAEADRIKFLQSVDGADLSNQGVVKLYEKLLPYAVIFGLEKSWLKEMSKYYEFDDVAAPGWYFGTGAFIASDFSDSISEMSSFASSSISHSTSSSSSSSGSGFSGGGGGFSGGGGGGGGGGTW